MKDDNVQKPSQDFAENIYQRIREKVLVEKHQSDIVTDARQSRVGVILNLLGLEAKSLGTMTDEELTEMDSRIQSYGPNLIQDLATINIFPYLPDRIDGDIYTMSLLLRVKLTSDNDILHGVTNRQPPPLPRPVGTIGAIRRLPRGMNHLEWLEILSSHHADPDHIRDYNNMWTSGPTSSVFPDLDVKTTTREDADDTYEKRHMVRWEPRLDKDKPDLASKRIHLIYPTEDLTEMYHQQSLCDMFERTDIDDSTRKGVSNKYTPSKDKTENSGHIQSKLINTYLKKKGGGHE